MKSFVKFCLFGAVLSGVSLVLFLVSLTQRGRNDFALLGGSYLRLSAGLILSGLLGFFLILAFILRKKPAWDKRAETMISRQLETTWLRESLLFLTGFVILLCTIPVFNVAITQEQRFDAIVTRYFWLLFLIGSFATLAILWGVSNPHRNRWLLAVLLSFLFFTMGLVTQTSLLAQMENRFAATQNLLILNQFTWALLIWPLSYWIASQTARERNLWLVIAITVFGLFILEWALLPRKLNFTKPELAFYSPILIFGTLLLTVLVLYGWNLLVRITHGKVEWFAKAIILCVLIGLSYFYFQGALKHARTINTSLKFSDQSPYLSFIETARDLNFQYTGDQNRMPAYPYFQALFYRPPMSEAALFAQGKWINIVLSLVLLAFFFVIWRKFLSFYQATLLLLIVAFSLYIFKAPYIQAEISFYFISFLSFVLMLQMLLKPGWLLAIATGIVAGVGYLTKGTIFPAVLLFVCIYMLKETIGLVSQIRLHSWAGEQQSIRRYAYLALVLIIFIGVIYPYIHQMKQRFGNYFYNVNTTIYIWYDNMQQAYAGEARYDFSERIPPDLPPDQIPSLQKYIREHTFQQAIDRFKDGAYSELAVIGWQFGVSNYQLAFTWIFLIVLLADFKNSLWTARKYPYILAFVALYFLGYFVAFAWYSPLASGRRFVYGLYIPFLFAIFVGINALARQQVKTSPDGKTPISIAHYFTTTNLIILFTLIYNIWVVLTASLFFDRYGS